MSTKTTPSTWRRLPKSSTRMLKPGDFTSATWRCSRACQSLVSTSPQPSATGWARSRRSRCQCCDWRWVRFPIGSSFSGRFSFRFGAAGFGVFAGNWPASLSRAGRVCFGGSGLAGARPACVEGGVPSRLFGPGVTSIVRTARALTRMPSGDKIIESSLLNSLGAQVLRTIAARLIYNTCPRTG